MSQKCRRVPRSRRRPLIVSCEHGSQTEMEREHLELALLSERHSVGNMAGRYYTLPMA